MSDTLADVQNHLEFRGYELEIRTEGESVFARHPIKPNVRVEKWNSGLLHTVIWRTTTAAKDNKLGIFEAINGVNRRARVARLYLDDDLDIFIEGYYPGAYARPSYNVFLDSWDRDLDSFTDDTAVMALID